MANQEHLAILKQGVEAWNKWREEFPDIQPDLSQANLSGTDLHYFILSKVDLHNAILIKSDLRGAHLSFSNLEGADLSDAALNHTELFRTNLSGANLTGAELYRTNFNSTNLSNANLYGASLARTIFADIDLRKIKGLESANHVAPSTIGIDTLIRSEGDIPVVFLKGAGATDGLIEYAKSFVGQAIEYHTCFISYSSKDQAFAERLYADLQSHNVRCWFAPEDLKIGDKIRVRIDESIRTYDKLLLVLSEHSVESNWVEYEVEVAFAKETIGKSTVLFPIRLDDTVIESSTAWAAQIKNTRHIGDFREWKNHDDYQRAFKRLLRDLKSETKSNNE